MHENATNHNTKAFKGHLNESQTQSKQGPHTDKSVGFFSMSFPVIHDAQKKSRCWKNFCSKV